MTLKKVSNACLTLTPCLNGGTCQVTGQGSSYTCTCSTGFSGLNCQICKKKNKLFFQTKKYKLIIRFDLIRQSMLQ